MADREFLFPKKYKCPICEKEFDNLTVKSNRARLVGTDTDLRPRYDQLDVLKYDVVCCPHCGYGALTRYFDTPTDSQRKKIKQMVWRKVTPLKTPESGELSYEEASERHKLALLNQMVKTGDGPEKKSEKGYICLKLGWIHRGWWQSLEGKIDQAELDKIKVAETRYLKNAYELFLEARGTESFPMCGMDEVTVDYLIAALAIRYGQMDVAKRMVSGILGSFSASSRIKDKARELLENAKE